MAKRTARARDHARDALVVMPTTSSHGVNRKKGRKGYRMWTDDEKDALARGVKKYGIGNWNAIKKDVVLGPKLVNRTNVDLKDKWRGSTTPTKSGLTRTQPLSPLGHSIIEEARENNGQVIGSDFERQLSPTRLVERSPFGSHAAPNERLVVSPSPRRLGFNSPPRSPSSYTPRPREDSPETDADLDAPDLVPLSARDARPARDARSARPARGDDRQAGCSVM